MIYVSTRGLSRGYLKRVKEILDGSEIPFVLTSKPPLAAAVHYAPNACIGKSYNKEFDLRIRVPGAKIYNGFYVDSLLSVPRTLSALNLVPAWLPKAPARK